MRLTLMNLCKILVVSLCVLEVSGNGMFKVDSKFKAKGRNLKELVAHDLHRHGRMLGSIGIPLGGNGLPSDAGLYFTKLRMGTPPIDYYVQVDTGSDILWVNCADCQRCPKRSGLGIKLNLFDPKSSSTSNIVTCNEKACTMIYQGILTGCEDNTNLECRYAITYGDGSATSGYFVEDILHYDKVSGNLQTTTGNASIVFGCGDRQSGQLSSSDQALDGIIGFGQANSSVISQLAAAGKAKKMFSHCLDSVEGGGIFAIGEVVEPKMKSTPLIPNQAHYNVIMKSINIGGDVQELSTDISDTDRGAIIDSGTTLAYFPDDIYELMVKKVFSEQPSLQLHTVEDQFKCFQYSGNIDDGFPNIVFNFENSLNLTVYPHDYFFALGDGDDKWCVGWMNSGLQSRDGKDVTILGDLVLSNKLVFYDLENQSIGWTKYNCSSSIKVKDANGAVYTVGAHDLSSANSLISPWGLLFFVFIYIFTIYH